MEKLTEEDKPKRGILAVIDGIFVIIGRILAVLLCGLLGLVLGGLLGLVLGGLLGSEFIPVDEHELGGVVLGAFWGLVIGLVLGLNGVWYSLTRRSKLYHGTVAVLIVILIAMLALFYYQCA